MNKKEYNKLDALYDYIEEQKQRADINEDTYNILQKISDTIANIIYII